MILLILLLIIFFSNNHITITRQIPASRRKRKAARALSIVHISDLHNKSFGMRQSYLIRKIQSLHPDMIAVTGDLTDGAPFQHAVTFIQKAAAICPVFYVRGNHESLAGNYDKLEKYLLKYHVTILKNQSVLFHKNGMDYMVTGLDDPKFQGLDHNYASLMHKTLDQTMAQMNARQESRAAMAQINAQQVSGAAMAQMDARQESGAAGCHILLSHRPELFHLYSRYPFDLVLCGHAHGGQFRLPYIGGLYAPNQGIFPKYDSGMHVENGTVEIISRGLGNSSFPLRLWNFPEIVHIIIS